MIKSRSVLNNAGWNLAGMVVPIAGALIAFPFLIRGLGAEQFGVLAIGWVVMNYFSLFDLGLGRATTKFISELKAQGKEHQLAATVWTSLHLHVLLGLTGGSILALCTPWLAGRSLNIPVDLQDIAFETFLWLAASTPFIVVSACLRGLLEAANRFDAANKVKIVGGLFNYFAPLVVLQFSSSLASIVAVIVIGRVITMIMMASYCFSALPTVRRPRWPSLMLVKPLFSLGGWITVSSLIAPVIMVWDRLLIAGFFSMATVTYYVTPYEVVTKLWILSASLLGALFPVMSALACSDRDSFTKLGVDTERHLLIVGTPLVGCILVFGRELLYFWVGPDFANLSTAVAKWLAVGVLLNILAQAPITMLQASGRADIIAKLQLLQLPPYLLLAWALLHQFGSVGVAMAWAARAAIEGAIAWVAVRHAHGSQPIHVALSPPIWLPAALFLTTCWAIDSGYRGDFVTKLVIFPVPLIVFMAWMWHVPVTANERHFVLAWLRRHIRYASNR